MLINLLIYIKAMNNVLNHRLHPTSVIFYLALSEVDDKCVFCEE